MKQLSIIQVITQRRFSGAERVCLSLCSDLQQRGHRVLLLCKPDGGMPEEAEKLGIDVRTPAISGKLNLAAPFRIAGLCRDFRADVIHTHLSTASLWGGIAGKLAGIPVLGHVHALNTWFYYRFSELAATCSEGVRQHVVAQGADASKVRVVYNGIPLRRFDDFMPVHEARQMLGIPPEALVAGCVAHLSAKKGQSFLLKAIKLLSSRFPELYCVLAGEGEMYEELQQLAVQLGIEKRVRLLGFRSDVISVMNAMDVVILPSVAKEGLGLVLVEAALLEKPSVGSNAPGIDEVIQDGITGLLATPGSAESIAEKLGMLLDNPGLARKMGAAGSERAKQLFAQDRMVDSFEAIYREMIKG